MSSADQSAASRVGNAGHTGKRHCHQRMPAAFQTQLDCGGIRPKTRQGGPIEATYCECPRVQSQYLVVYRLTNPFSGRTMSLALNGPVMPDVPSAGVTRVLPQSGRSHHMSCQDAPG